MLTRSGRQKARATRIPFYNGLRDQHCKFTICSQPHVDPIAYTVPQPRQATGFSAGQAMQNSVHIRQHRHRTSSPQLRFAHRLCQWLGIAMLALSLFLAFSIEGSVHARGGPTRRDRRPDREVRISYPRSQPQSSGQSTGGQSSHSQSSGTVLQNVPPAAATPSTPNNANSSPPTE